MADSRLSGLCTREPTSQIRLHLWTHRRQMLVEGGTGIAQMSQQRLRITSIDRRKCLLADVSIFDQTFWPNNIHRTLAKNHRLPNSHVDGHIEQLGRDLLIGDVISAYQLPIVRTIDFAGSRERLVQRHSVEVIPQFGVETLRDAEARASTRILSDDSAEMRILVAQHERERLVEVSHEFFTQPLLLRS